MGSASLEILIILLLILVNGVLAMAEIAVVSARKIRLQQQADSGFPGAKAALDLANEPSHFLSTVQIGITLVGILAGAYGGATLAEELGAYLSQNDIIEEYSETIGVTIVVLLISYLSLVIGELAPKQIGLMNPERIAASIAPSMVFLSKAAAPVVSFLSFSSTLLLRIFGFRPTSDPEITEEEIKIIIEQGTESGVLEPIEEEMVERVFRLSDQRVGVLMTSRLEVTWINIDDPVEMIKETISTGSYSRYPVAQGTLDNVTGIVQAKDILKLCFSGLPIDIKSAQQPALFIPESMPVFVVLDRFRESKTQIALVIDEYGGIQGLVTTTDILEAIAGEFPDLQTLPDPDIVQREDGSWLIDGMVTTDHFKDLFNIHELPGDEQNLYQTLGGFVMTSLGRIPIEGDVFEWEGIRFEVIDMDGYRVDKVLIKIMDTGV